MRHVTRKPRELKVRRYAYRMINLNEYLAVFPESKSSEKIADTEFQMSGSGNLTYRVLIVNLFKRTVNIFERMEIAEYIYEGVVEPSY